MATSSDNRPPVLLKIKDWNATECTKWLNENATGQWWYYGVGIYQFENVEDEFLFLLKFR